jgi:hypothetical protein
MKRDKRFSLSAAVIRLLRKGAGIDEPLANDIVGTSLDDLIGTWTAAEAEEFDAAGEDFAWVDPTD